MIDCWTEVVLWNGSRCLRNTEGDVKCHRNQCNTLERCETAKERIWSFHLTVILNKTILLSSVIPRHRLLSSLVQMELFQNGITILGDQSSKWQLSHWATCLTYGDGLASEKGDSLFPFLPLFPPNRTRAESIWQDLAFPNCVRDGSILDFQQQMTLTTT